VARGNGRLLGSRVDQFSITDSLVFVARVVVDSLVLPSIWSEIISGFD